jgi:hypothetical protein
MKKIGLKKIGEGDNFLVYKYNNAGVVFKIHHNYSLLVKEQTGFKKYITLSNQHVLQTKNDYRALCKYFPNSTILDIYTHPIEINTNEGEMFEDFLSLESNSKQVSKKVTSLIKKNKETPLIITQEYFPITSRAIELRVSVPDRKYFEKTFFIELKKGPFVKTKKILDLYVQRSPFIKKIEKRKDIHTSATLFMKNLIRYTKREHTLLDIFGPNNVLFYKKDGAITYKILDPILGKQFYSNNPSFSFQTITEFLKNTRDIRHFYIYINFINLLAKKLNMKERITPEDIFGAHMSKIKEEITQLFS